MPRSNYMKPVSNPPKLDKPEHVDSLSIVHRGDVKDGGISVYGSQTFCGNVHIGHVYNHLERAASDDALLCESAASSKLLSQVAEDTANTAAGMRRTEAAVESLSTTVREGVDDLKGRLSIQIHRQLQEQAESFQSSGLEDMVQRGVLAAFKTHLWKASGTNEHQRCATSSFRAQEDVKKATRTETSQQPFARSTKFHVLSTTTYRTPFLTVIVRTITHQKTSCDRNAESGSSPIEADFEVQLRLDFLRKIIFITRHRQKHDCGFDMSLRTRNTVSWDAPILEVVEKLDIEAAKELFELRHASPFDITLGGHTLLDHCFQRFHHIAVAEAEAARSTILSSETHMWERVTRANTVQDTVTYQRYAALYQMMRFLIGCTTEWTSPELHEICFNLSEITATPNQEILREIAQQVLAHARINPIEVGDADFGAPLQHDLEFSMKPVGQMLKQQDQWAVDWNAQYKQHWSDDVDLYLENDRHVLEDPNGEKLSALLAQYPYLSYGIWTRGSCNPFENVFIDLLSTGARQKMRAGCLNRLIILLNHGHDPEEVWKVLAWLMQHRQRRSASEHAIRKKWMILWKEALKSTGRSEIEIMHLLDETVYQGIPELLDGDVVYMSHDEGWEDFMEGLFRGRYVDYSEVDVVTVSESCSVYLKVPSNVICDYIRASKAAFGIKKIPGSWLQLEGSLFQPVPEDEMGLEIEKLRTIKSASRKGIKNEKYPYGVIRLKR